jgi:hypothetical protein
MITYRKAHEAYETSLINMHNLRMACFAFILANMTQSSLDALKLDTKSFSLASEQHDLVLLRSAVESTHSTSSLIAGLTLFNTITSAKQGNESLTTFFTKTSLLVTALALTFASPTNPKFISIKALHIAIIFAGINANHFQPYLDKLSLDTSLTHMDQLEVSQVTAALTTFDLNRTSRAANNNTTQHPNSDMSLKQAQRLVMEHNAKHQQQQSNTGNALINSSPTTNNNTNKKDTTNTTTPNTTNTDPRRCQWSTEHPHTWVTRTSPGPGNINLPHCPHCALNGHILNNHGHGTLKPCSDIRTASDEQQALLSNFVALMNGTASQHQRDSLNVFMDSGIFDASALASMNSGLGAPVPDADADEEARRACGGGPAPKN